MSNPVFNLPAYTLGPYTLRVKAVKKAEMSDKRRIVEHDWNLGHTLMADHLNTRRALECLFRSLVTAIHYRSGLNDKSDEESFTHSLATGLVELAQNNPRFWFELHELLEQDYCPGAEWGRVAGGQVTAQSCVLPTQVVYDGHICALNWVEPGKWSDKNAYGFYWLKSNKIDIDTTLRGNNLALVLFHEVLHFLHEKLGLKSSTNEKTFKRTQAAALPRFIQQNPQFWAWWLRAVNEGNQMAWQQAA